MGKTMTIPCKPGDVVDMTAIRAGDREVIALTNRSELRLEREELENGDQKFTFIQPVHMFVTRKG